MLLATASGGAMLMTSARGGSRSLTTAGGSHDHTGPGSRGEEQLWGATYGLGEGRGGALLLTTTRGSHGFTGLGSRGRGAALRSCGEDGESSCYYQRP